MSEAIVITKGKQAAKEIMKVSGAGFIVGLEQIGLEQVDKMLMAQGNLKDDMQFESTQNIVPIVQSIVAIIASVKAKNKTIREIGTLLMGPSVAMATYRGAKFLPARLTVTAHRIANMRSLQSNRPHKQQLPGGDIATSYASAGNLAGLGRPSALVWTPLGLQS